MDKNRKTTLPIRSSPEIVVWLLKHCTKEEKEFLAEIGGKRKNFETLNSILTKLTDYNIHEVFYEDHFQSSEELSVFRAAKRGEVAGLKAFSLACFTAQEEIVNRKKHLTQAKNIDL